MIQLSSRKKIILLSLIILIVVVFIILFVVKNNKSKNSLPPENIATPEVTETLPTRDMTEAEKIEVGISPTQAAEVVNEKNGLFIYRIKK